MGATKSLACFLLLSAALLSVPLAHADGVIATSDELLGLQAGCDKSSDGSALNTFVLQQDACKTCMSDLNILASPVNTRMYACHTVCQNPQYFSASTGPASQCETCLSQPNNTPYGCENCLRVLTSEDDRTACFTCLSQDPTHGKRPDYMWACAQCQTIPAVDAKQQCLKCISTDQAVLISKGGMLTPEEFNSPTYVARDNDFGACVVLANRTYNINIGSVEVDGVYANCVPQGYAAAVTKPFLPLTPANCMKCMSTVLENAPPATTSFLHKEYACSSYCQDPTAFPWDLTNADSDVQNKAEALATACVACAEDQGVTDAWGCGNCMKAVDSTACFTCVQGDPYDGKASNYNWACGQCGRIADEALRGLCFECIANQPTPDLQGDSGIISNANFNISTEANICSCIDLTLNSSIPIARALDAQQRACFEPQQYYNGTTLVTPNIPWGSGTFQTDNTNIATTTSACIECINDARTQVNSAWDPTDASIAPLNFPTKAYACTEYCQDPRLVLSEADGDACASCVQAAQITDAFGCKMCMEATADSSERDDCFSCLKAPTGFSNYQWGCAECAKFGNADARKQCYRCLAGGDTDPCDCVTETKNGTLPEVPAGGCDKPGYQVRIWYMVATSPGTAGPYTLDTATWAIDTANPWAAPFEGAHSCTGTFSGDKSHYLFSTSKVFFDDDRDDVYTQYIDLTGCSLTAGSEYFFTVKDATTNAPSSNTVHTTGLVFWDLSQPVDADGASYYYVATTDKGILQAGTTPIESGAYSEFGISGSLSFQLLDACNDVLVDTITTSNFGMSLTGVSSETFGDQVLTSGSTYRFAFPSA